MTSDMSISVVIPTCNRPDDIERCLLSLTCVQYPAWEVLVIDQSDDDRSESIVRDFTNQLPHLTYCRMAEKGVSRARNFGLRFATGDVLSFLDDDCTVDPDWLTSVANAFCLHPDVDLVFGSVFSAPHDPLVQFIPGHTVARDSVLRGRLSFLRIGGIMGACMHLRRPLLDAGIPYDVAVSMGEDRDFAYRVLATGHAVLVTPSIRIQHYGARDFAGGVGSRHVHKAAHAWGALDMKYLRCHDAAMLVMIPAHFLHCLARVNLAHLILGRRPTHLSWPIQYLRGQVSGVRPPVMRLHQLWGAELLYEPGDLSSRGTNEVASWPRLAGEAVGPVSAQGPPG